MRLLTSNVPPRDRRLDRGKVAIIAAALLLFAAWPAKAGIVGMNIDPTQSFVSVSKIIDLTAIGFGIYTTVAQFPDPDGPGPLTGSNKTSLSGNLIVDFGAGFTDISFPGGSTVNFSVNNTPGVGGVPGSYVPFDPVTMDPNFPPVGTTPNANYGLVVGSPLFWLEVRYNLIADLVGPVRQIIGGAFALLPGSDLLVGTDGRIAYASALDIDTSSVVGQTLAALGTGGASAGTWDGMTLTVPIESSFTVPLEVSPGVFVSVTYVSNSSIVATPIVPEPASMVLLAFGALGIFTFAWRFRSRRLASRVTFASQHDHQNLKNRRGE